MQYDVVTYVKQEREMNRYQKSIQGVIICMMVGLLAGCGGGDDDSSEENSYDTTLETSFSSIDTGNDSKDDPIQVADPVEEYLNGFSIVDPNKIHFGYAPTVMEANSFNQMVCEQYTPYRYLYGNLSGGCNRINGQVAGKECHLHVAKVFNDPKTDNKVMINLAKKYATEYLYLADRQLYELDRDENGMSEFFISSKNSNSESYIDFVVTCAP